MLSETQKEKLYSIHEDYVQNNEQWFEELDQRNDADLDRKDWRIIPEVLDWLEKFFLVKSHLKNLKQVWMG
jgi:hypothetical protein